MSASVEVRVDCDYRGDCGTYYYGREGQSVADTRDEARECGWATADRHAAARATQSEQLVDYCPEHADAAGVRVLPDGEERSQ